MSGIAKSWRIFKTHVQPRRLFQEDSGVRGPLWFGREPDSDLHALANLLRLFCAIFLAPVYIFIPHTSRPTDNILKRILWGVEWAGTPDAILLESPGSLAVEGGSGGTVLRGQYAVTGNKPKWLLEVVFRGTTIVSQTQVKELRKRIQMFGYTAISYAMKSAEELFFGAKGQLDPQPKIQPGGKRKYTLRNRQKISQAVLDEYALARRTIEGKGDGVEFIWLDEFCLSDHRVTDEQEVKRQRDTEVGQLADIFRGAKRVIVFCHTEDCDHTDIDCPWSNRLFTIGEILYTPEVLQMTRTSDDLDNQGRLHSHITVISGQEFRADMQARAAEAKMWHLYNVMQHATNSGAVTWQSAIHSLVVEAIRRDEADGFHEHNFLGKALNGLLPRRSQLDDLQGVDGWADLAWLLELNQGYYNTTLLAAVCRLAGPNVQEYRWWGKPIAPKEGSERLEALVTAIPANFRGPGDQSMPVLSVIDPKSISLSHWLQRDSAGLYHDPEMKSLMLWAISALVVLFIIGVGTITTSLPAGIVVLWLSATAFVILELLVGTMFVVKDTWIVVEDHTIAPDHDPFKWLQFRDHTFSNATEWGSRQLIPEWEKRSPSNSNSNSPGIMGHPHAATLIDLRTHVLTRTFVTGRPNDMVVLAVHGSGITCMLLDRDEKAKKVTVAAKVGMANFPPFILAQAEPSGTVYIGGGPVRGQPRSPRVSTPQTDYKKLSAPGNYDEEKLGGHSGSPIVPNLHRNA
ncbi:hypothetical protein P691DRAFT_734994 [Macrolepiota fuliginosa MF-IS2]|uniref:Heterokaryon incompatibility domain-containing protein n=1 Tax=Macrolepiota fuliginosa MF-IS2 TaxID=1400762 RepID=A0A9P5X6G4_9AGAR|nr:hypothetical protein P691DRAFT_734994 [Macrolepiota fuliginosa MF-IS2]